MSLIVRVCATILSVNLIAFVPVISGNVQGIKKLPAVTLHVLVLDQQMRPVDSLSKDDFQVFEEGVQQTVSFFSKDEEPINYILLIDTSGSMKNRMGETLEAAWKIIRTGNPANETFLIEFKESPEAITDDFTADKMKLFEGLKKKLSAGAGGTALIDAVWVSLEAIAEHKKTHPTLNKRYALVLLTDGNEKLSHYDDKKLFERLSKENVQMFILALTNYPDKKIKPMSQRERERALTRLNRLAKETGGYAFFPETGDALLKAASEVMLYMHTQYKIGYDPATPGSKGSYRKVVVKVLDKPGRDQYTTSTQAGYVISQN